MIGGVLTGLLFGKIGYYLVLAWCCVSIFVFMVSGAWGGLGGRGEAEATGLLDRLGEVFGASKSQIWGLGEPPGRGSLLCGLRDCQDAGLGARVTQYTGSLRLSLSSHFCSYLLGSLPACP